MEISILPPRRYLEEEYKRRKLKNKQYTLRSFAASLDLPSGRLSEILSGKRRVSEAMASRLADRLGLNPECKRAFLSSLAEERGLSPSLTLKPSTDEYFQIELDQFQIVTEWLHFAILSAMNTKNFKPDPVWVAKYFGVSTVEVRSAIERLERAGLIRTESGGWKRTKRNFTTTHDINSTALRKSHAQTLEQAIACLDTVPVELRDITSITMAIDVAKIQEAKVLIKKFRRSLSAFLEEGTQTQVYNLNIQLVPVSKLSSERSQK